MRTVDATQFERRRIGFDFDMMEYRWEQSLSPGNEQLFYWGSAAADQQGSRNYMGVKSKAVDAMIAACSRATSAGRLRRRHPRARPRAVVRLLRRAALLSCRYNGSRAGRESRIPLDTSLFGYLPETWWQKDLKP